MEKTIFEAFQPGLIERLGECYCQNEDYKQGVEKEKELGGHLKEALTEEQMGLVEEYHAAIYSTVGTCELLAYRQGMRDMASILYGR